MSSRDIENIVELTVQNYKLKDALQELWNIAYGRDQFHHDDLWSPLTQQILRKLQPIVMIPSERACGVKLSGQIGKDIVCELPFKHLGGHFSFEHKKSDL